MKPLWLLQTDIFEENLEPLKESILTKGSQYGMFKYVPFDGELLTTADQSLYKSLPAGPLYYFPYCSINAMFKLRKYAGMPKGMRIIDWLFEDKMKCSSYIPHLYKFLLNRNHYFLTWDTILRKEDRLFDKSDRVFVRPDSGLKSFTGFVLDKNDPTEPKFNDQKYNPGLNSLCLVAPYQKIQAEWRVVVGHEYPYEDNQSHYITSSMYKVDGKFKTWNSDTNLALKDYVNILLKKTNYSPAPYYVLDIALNDRLEFKVLEVNSLQCSGLYDCDIDKIVKCVHDYCEQDTDFYFPL